MEGNKSVASQTMVVILAAGKGTRMGTNDIAKVCFEIDSVPAISRLITTFKKLRFNKILLVVGIKADDVMKAVGSENSDVMYVYQERQLGTGHAAKIAADLLQNIGFDGNVLVTLGDKFIEETAIEVVVKGFVKQQADMTLLAIPKAKATEGSSGKVFVDKYGQAVDIVEKIDLSKQAIADELKENIAKNKAVTSGGILKIINKYINKPDRQAVAVAELLALAKQKNGIDKEKLAKILQSKKYNLEIDGKRYTAKQIEKKCPKINPSLYLFKAKAFYQGVATLDNNNASRQYYFTDIVRNLNAIKDAQDKNKFKARLLSINDSKCIQGFNSPDELLAIQDYVRQKKIRKQKTVSITPKPKLKKSQYCTVRQWLNKINEGKPSLKRWFDKIYGRHEQLHQQKSKNLISVLKCYGKKFGFDEKVCIVRAPGRVNVMGRHVDHRGGFTNFLAIDRETVAIAGLRKDNNVVAVNTEPKKFKPVQFNISELIGRFAWSDWINFVDSGWVRNMVHSAAGNWGNYIKAAMLRLQHQYQDVKVQGVNLAVTGNVPIAAGLSSSSTIVVATLQAAIALNNFELTSRQFIDICGEGEWFVGSRGGAGDHAAIYLGQRGKIAHVGHMPFVAEKIIDAPVDYQVIIANSHIKANKSSIAKHTFNEKITSYNLGFALLKQRCPQITNTVEYLRDINPEKLGCSIADIYRLLLKVPEFMTRKDFKIMLSKDHTDLIKINFASHAEPKQYKVRGVLLFGISEIARSKLCIDYLESENIESFGKLMNISHDGDRVSRCGPDGKYHLIQPDCSDQYLNRFIADLASEDPDRVLNGQLYMQPGGYTCSTPQIDQMVDIARSVPGVAGAQLTGAGLGGCIMVLAKKEAVDAVKKALIKNYYRPNKLQPAVIPCIVTEGAGVAEF